MEERLGQIMERFTALESVAVEENRARFLYLKGKLLNVTGEFSSQVSFSSRVVTIALTNKNWKNAPRKSP